MAVRIVTDSSCDLTADEAEDLGIDIVPLSIRFGDKEFTDRVDLSVEEFYRRLSESEALPETAAPSPGAFEQIFRRLFGWDKRLIEILQFLELIDRRRDHALSHSHETRRSIARGSWPRWSAFSRFAIARNRLSSLQTLNRSRS